MNLWKQKLHCFPPSLLSSRVNSTLGPSLSCPRFAGTLTMLTLPLLASEHLRFTLSCLFLLDTVKNGLSQTPHRYFIFDAITFTLVPNPTFTSPPELHLALRHSHGHPPSFITSPLVPLPNILFTSPPELHLALRHSHGHPPSFITSPLVPLPNILFASPPELYLARRHSHGPSTARKCLVNPETVTSDC